MGEVPVRAGAVTVETRTVHAVVFRSDDRRDYVRVTLDEGLGLCTLNSSWCDGSAYWQHRGPGCSLARFVAGIDSSYARNNLLPTSLHTVDDYDATAAAIREAIAEQVDSNEAPYRAADERELAEQVEQGSLTFEEWRGETSLDEPWHYWHTMENPQWTALWNRVWVPHIRPALVQLAEQQEALRVEVTHG